MALLTIGAVEGCAIVVHYSTDEGEKTEDTTLAYMVVRYVKALSACVFLIGVYFVLLVLVAYKTIRTGRAADSLFVVRLGCPLIQANAMPTAIRSGVNANLGIAMSSWLER